MASVDHDLVPVEIQLHQKSRVLEIGFDDGARFRLPVEYLRVFSPAAEVRTARQRGEFLTGKESVNIIQITPVGGYAVQLHFDDGHETGVYAWKTLYELGRDQDKQWPAYLARRAQASATPATVGARRVRLLFFASLATDVGRDAEEVDLPTTVGDVRGLLRWLGGRGGAWQRALGAPTLTVAINKQFAEPSSTLKDGDEIALVPASAAEHQQGG
jgi:DUF971 family protein/molybdopterin converting factor small subunit